MRLRSRRLLRAWYRYERAGGEEERKGGRGWMRGGERGGLMVWWYDPWLGAAGPIGSPGS
jgi:hypothetical protein